MSNLRTLVCCAICLCTHLRAGTQNIIAYYSGDGKSIQQYPLGELTHIIYGFCHLAGNKIAVNKKQRLAIKELVRIKQSYRQIKIMVSLGGWGGCKTCSAVFSTASGRESFALSVVKLLDSYRLDGIDIDWEFPALPAYPGHGYSPFDRENFSALLCLLREKLSGDKEISFLAAAFSPYLQQSVDWPHIMKFATRVNLMTYDIIGSRSSTTGHHAALYSTPFQKESADNAVKYLDSLKVPLNKIALGAAFYARAWDSVPPENNGLYQPGKFEGFIPLKRVRLEFGAWNGYRQHWDTTAEAAYRYSPIQKKFLSYDEEKSVAAKARYVKQKGLNGIMFWELRLDKNRGGLTDAIYKVFRK